MPEPDPLANATVPAGGTQLLGAWSLASRTGAIALVRNGSVLLVNEGWRELDGQEPGAVWLAVHGNFSGTLELLVVRHAAQLISGELVPGAPCLFEHGERSVEARFELAPGLEREVIALAYEITDRVRTERELLVARRALAVEERMRLLGRMVAGVAHDLASCVLALRASLDAGAGERLVRQAIDDMATRVERLHETAREAAAAPSDGAPLAQVIEKAIALARYEFAGRGDPARWPIAVSAPRRLPLVCGRPVDLQHVLVNLLCNARDAMPDGGPIEIATHVARDGVHLEVGDRGIGLAAEVAARLFEPFFTTKGALGTGLGLAMSRHLLNEFGGRIAGDNRAGGGATFSIFLPRAGRSHTRASIHSK